MRFILVKVGTIANPTSDDAFQIFERQLDGTYISATGYGPNSPLSLAAARERLALVNAQAVAEDRG